MSVLVDTSVWVDYFRGGERSADVDFLLDENLLVTNDIVLAELTPFLKIRRENRLVRLLNAIAKMPLEVDWEQIKDMQYKCLASGANGIGIPDLLIAQHAKQHKLRVYSLDRHFHLLHNIHKLVLYTPSGGL